MAKERIWPALADRKWHKKCWGRTRCVNDGPYSSTHELELLAGGYCSFHYHENRCNQFQVLEGVVRVVWSVGWRLQFDDLSAFDVLNIPSMVGHQFQVLTPGKMVEVYYPDRGGMVDNDDIVRLSEGNRADVDWLTPPKVYKHNGEAWKGY